MEYSNNLNANETSVTDNLKETVSQVLNTPKRRIAAGAASVLMVLGLGVHFAGGASAGRDVATFCHDASRFGAQYQDVNYSSRSEARRALRNIAYETKVLADEAPGEIAGDLKTMSKAAGLYADGNQTMSDAQFHQISDRVDARGAKICAKYIDNSANFNGDDSGSTKRPPRSVRPSASYTSDTSVMAGN